MSADVDHAARTCRLEGCQLHKVSGLMTRVADTLNDLTGRESMSQALWCDQGGHAFSERDPGRQRISVTVLVDDAEKQEARDLCGQCAIQSGLLQPRRTRPAAVPGGAYDTPPPGYRAPE